MHAPSLRAALVGTLFLASLVTPSIVAAAGSFAHDREVREPTVELAQSCPISYPTFVDGTGLNLLGDAAVETPALRVTPANPDRVGQAWHAARVRVADGFVTDFTVQLTGMAGAGDDDGPGGDGLTFTIQDASETATGAGGGSLGYGGIIKSLAVELDTFENPPNDDLDGNHIGLHSRGEAPNGPELDAQLVAATAFPTHLQDGAVHQVRVSYVPGEALEVFIDGATTPVVSTEIDLETFLGLTDGQAWVGFTAATGGAYEAHDILSWTYCETNLPPVVDAGPDVAGDEGAAVALDGTVTDPEDGTLTTTWSYTAGPDVDPGATCAFADPAAVDTTISCTDDGTYSVTLTASDGVNPEVADTTSLALANVPPTVDITTPADGAVVGVDATVALSATITDPGTNDSHGCSIDWGDGTVEDGTIVAGICTADHVYAAIGPYTVAISVTDDDDGSGTDSVAITVAEETDDQPPVVEAGPDVAGDEGAAVALDATVTDPEGTAVTTAWSYTAGPDVDPGASCAFADPAAVDTTISCTDDGSYTLTLSASDGVNPAVTDSTALTLANVPPAVEITAPADGAGVSLGSVIELAATITDPGTNDSHGCTIDWGDGTISDGVIAVGICAASHTYGAAGSYTVIVSATDDDGGSGTDSVAITVDACTVVGTEADDIVTGTIGPDVLCGLGGDDVLIGLAGTDVFIGGEGDDRLRGGGGSDTVSYALASGPVFVSLASGDASGAHGTDVLSNIENVVGSTFDDRIIGDGDGNTLVGLGGRDHISGRAGQDLLDGGTESDLLEGGGGNDEVIGGPSPTAETTDRLFGDGGKDDLCLDGPGLADFKDASCERTTDPTEARTRARGQPDRDRPQPAPRRVLSGRGLARPA